MEGYYESGPLPPKNEAEKVGEALYLALKGLYGDYSEISKSYLANGDPRVVTIEFEYLKKNDGGNQNDLLSEFQEDTERIITSFNIPENVDVEYKSEDDSAKRSEAVTIRLTELS
ncbi:MAG: hypothetical protein ACK42D_03950 [Candidatus Paceibacteria bacterium]